MCEGKSNQGLGAKKERLIEILLIVVGFVLAGSHSSGNTLFYYAAFAFLTFAIVTRALAAFNTSNAAYSILYIMFSLFMAFSFPLVFVSYFHSKVFQLTTGNTVVYSTIVITALTLFLFISLTEGLYSNVGGYVNSILDWISQFLEKPKEYLKNKKWFCLIVAFILLFIVVFFFDFLLLKYSMAGSRETYLSEYVSQNTSMTSEASLFEDAFTVLATVFAAILGGMFTLWTVKYQERMKIEHQKKYIATGFYYEIKALETKIHRFIGIFKKLEISYGGTTPTLSTSIFALGKEITESKIDLNYKPLYSTSGLYYQFIKEIYVFEDELIKNILYFYNNLLAADDFYQFHKNYLERKETDNARSATEGFANCIYEAHKVLPDLIKGLEKYVTTTNDTPTPESACTTTQPSEKDAEQ